MPNYTSDGVENLRADPSVKDATTTGAYEKDEKAGSGGKDAGGDETNATTLANPGKSQPGGKESTPAGVQSFDGEAT